MELKNKTLSIIDANVNRAKEGLRVVEDITRFMLLKKNPAAGLKKIRHGIDSAVKKLSPDYNALLKSRDSAKDPGRKIKSKTEFSKRTVKQLLAANFKRAEESLRVLEEISKLTSVKAAKQFKELRYKTYEAEKKLILKV